MSDALHEVAALVHRESGVALREAQLPALDAAIARVAPGLDAEGLLAAVGRLGGGEHLVQRLIDEVTIKETFFLRHREELERVDFRALAAQAQARGATQVRVWSAACASGEEAYTLAILALDAFAPGAAPVDVLATDIATTAIDRAVTGRYGWRSVRNVAPEMRERWFLEDSAGLEVGPVPRRLVRFARHNLLRDPVPPRGEGPFDLIVCRNVLIYFRPEDVRATVARLREALAPGGVLLLGAADRLGLADDPGRPAPARRPRPERGPAAPRRLAAPRDKRRRAPEAPSPPEPAAASAAHVHPDFEQGVTALAEGDADAAVTALRRAVYLEPGHAAAAFQLARAHEARGDEAAARRAYWQALALLDAAGPEVGGVARVDLVSVCRSRLAVLGQA